MHYVFYSIHIVCVYVVLKFHIILGAAAVFLSLITNIVVRSFSKTCWDINI